MTPGDIGRIKYLLDRKVILFSEQETLRALRLPLCHDCGHRHIGNLPVGASCGEKINFFCSCCMSTWPSRDELRVVTGRIKTWTILDPDPKSSTP